ncbi:MAG: acetyl-coenzyme A synthetase N-terminal domain-containing protein, partial [Gammaproteobacteria bacterium]|nr:acetyl-coenzyme A synthetase N-terminal domain-containing protein [Gammaproteobacteria bacterium]
MSEVKTYPVDPQMAANTWVDADTRNAMYEESVADPDGFWRQQADTVDWIKTPTDIKQTSFAPGKIDIQWYADGQLNVAANCLDRHLAEHGDEIAIIWEGDDPADSRHISYLELHAEVCKFSNALL